jgi:hypothetical protein
LGRFDNKFIPEVVVNIRLTIYRLENVTEIKSMELVSSAGRVVAVLKVGTLKIDVSRLSSGAYFLSITHTNGTDRLRFVKE